MNSLYEPTFGNRIVIEHANKINGLTLITIYKHLKTRDVSIGSKVFQGQKIAQMGATGALAGGMSHLHFEVYYKDTQGNRIPTDPNIYWANGKGRVTCLQDTPERDVGLTYPVPCRD